MGSNPESYGLQKSSPFRTWHVTITDESLVAS